MRLATTRAIAAAALAAAIGSWAVRAHGEEATVEGRTLTTESLDAFLVEAGHPSKPMTGFRRVEVARDGTTYYCDVAISPDGRYVWLTVPLGALPASPVPHRPLVNLLAANGGEAGLHFLVSGDRIILARAVDNRDVTPHGLSQEIRRFTEGVRAGRALWDVASWPKGEGK
jgi:hypothetical protein